MTISQNGVYSDILELPKDLNSEQMIEVIGLNAAATLPLPLAECYIDWQVIEEGENKNKVMVSTIPREIADVYISVLRENGFSLIALEPASLSMARAADVSSEPVLFFYLTDEGITSAIYNQKNSYFSQFESWQEASGGKEIKNLQDLNKVLKTKTKNLIRYFENRYSPVKIKKVLLASEGFDADKIIKNIDFLDLPITKAKSNIASLKNYDWIPVAGAAYRAFVPRSEDMIISLLPVGTESLYETEKAASFVRSIALVALVSSLFYTIVFFAAFIFVSFLGSGVSSQMEVRSNMPVPAEYAKLESETREFNGYVNDLAAIYSKTGADYAKILENITKVSSSGIILTSTSLSDIAAPIIISGTALSRENLNVFKFQMENSQYFQNVKFSIQNIAQKNNIPFSITLYSK